MEEQRLVATRSAADSWDCASREEPGVNAAPGHKPAKRTRPRLAPWQVNIAREMMIRQLDCGLVLADIAERLSMSVNHFIKAFHEMEGVAPYHWFMQRRIAQAQTLLCDESMTLSSVANACGFADQSHFTKAFTRQLGIPPGRWRRKLRNAVVATG